MKINWLNTNGANLFLITPIIEQRLQKGQDVTKIVFSQNHNDEWPIKNWAICIDLLGFGQTWPKPLDQKYSWASLNSEPISHRSYLSWQAFDCFRHNQIQYLYRIPHLRLSETKLKIYLKQMAEKIKQDFKAKVRSWMVTKTAHWFSPGSTAEWVQKPSSIFSYHK